MLTFWIRLEVDVTEIELVQTDQRVLEDALVKHADRDSTALEVFLRLQS